MVVCYAMCFDIIFWLILTAHYVLASSLIHHATLIHMLVRQQAFSFLALCLALFKSSPFYTNPFASAKLFHMLLARPIYSTLTICSQQLLNEFFFYLESVRCPNLNPILWLNNSIEPHTKQLQT